MTEEQLEAIRIRYSTVPQMRYTTASINEQWAQCQKDVNALLAEIERLRAMISYQCDFQDELSRL
jgi:hypothetical protein